MKKDEKKVESNLMKPYNGFTSHGNDEKPDITAVQSFTYKWSVSVLNENGKGRREKKCAKRLSFEEGGTFGIITKIERIV